MLQFDEDAVLLEVTKCVRWFLNAILTKLSQSAVVPEHVCLQQPFELSETVTLL